MMSDNLAQYFNVIRMPLVMVPLVVSSVGDAYVALDRISTLLTAEEVGDDYDIDRTQELAIDMRGDFTWEAAGPPTDTAFGAGKKGLGKGKKGKEEEVKKTKEQLKEEAAKRSASSYRIHTRMHLDAM